MARIKKMQIFAKKIERLDFSHINTIKFVGSSYLSDSTFEATNLESLRVKHSTFRKVNFKKCILVRSKFSNCSLELSNLEFANLSGNSLFRSNFTKTNLQCTSFKNSTINESSLVNADLRWANLEGAAFIKSDLRKANFCNSNMNNVKIVKCKLNGATYNLHTVLPFSRDKAHELGMVYVQAPT